jgi:glycosyltransferase involved in cell wall biosynthesis
MEEIPKAVDPMRRLTVLVIAYPFTPVGPDAAGGAEQIVSSLDAELTARGLRLIVVAHSRSYTRGHLFGTRVPQGVITPEVRLEVERLHQANIDRALASFPVDLIHMHGFDFHRYRVPRHLPVLVTLHLPPSWYPQTIWTLSPNYHLQCVSQTQRNACPQHVRSRLAVVGNGVRLPASDSFSRKSRFAIMLSRICPEKNLHTGLDAAGLAGIPVLLAGRVFPYQEHLLYFEQQIRPRLRRGRARFLSHLSSELKSRLLSRAACLLLPSLAPETSSLVAMEAAAAGTPVIAFPSGAIAEMVDNGCTGFLVDNVEEMARAIERASQIDPAVCRAHASSRFSLTRMVQNYLDLYHAFAALYGSSHPHSHSVSRA